MSSINNVIITDEFANGLINSMTIESLSALTAQLATAAETAHDTLDTHVTNEIARLDALVSVATAAADRLDAYEKQQIEEVLNSLVSQEGFQQLLQSTAVVINGGTSSLQSVINALVASNNSVVRTQRLLDSNGKCNGAKFEMATGETGIMGMTLESALVSDKGSVQDHTYSFYSENWASSGIPAKFYVKTRDIEKSFDVFGITSSIKVGEQVIEKTNIVFDLAELLTGVREPVVSVPDMDGDGEIGMQ